MIEVENITRAVRNLSVDSTLFKIAPSKYGTFVSLNCDLYIRKATTIRKDSKTDARNAVGERMQLRGSAWESRICSHLISRCVPSSAEKYSDCTSITDFKAFLRDIFQNDKHKLVHYFYQVTTDVHDSEVPAQLRAVGATVSRIIPDLLLLTRESASEPWQLVVIDAKSSINMKQSHQAQVAFYAYFLARVFHAEIQSGLMTMATVGYIWLQSRDAGVAIESTRQAFQLAPWLQLVEQHLLRDIPRALSGAIEDVSWHLSLHCAPCAYLQDCRAPSNREEAVTATAAATAEGGSKMDIRALPHVARGDSQYLQGLALAYSDAPSSMQSSKVGKNKTAPPAGSASASLSKHSVQWLRTALMAATEAGRPDVRAAQILGETRSEGLLTSAIEHRAVVKGHLCGTLPSDGAGTSLYLSLSCDPATDLPFSYGLCVVEATATAPATATGDRVIAQEAKCAEWCADTEMLRALEQTLLLQFLARLCALICDDSTGTALTIYVWDGLEKYCLSQLIIKALCGEHSHLLDASPNLRRDLYFTALVVLDFPEQWHLPAPPPGVTEAQAGGRACTPRVCDVTSAYSALMHLPIAGFYQPDKIHRWSTANARGAALGGSTASISSECIEQGWLSSASSAVEATVRARVEALRSATVCLRQMVVARDPSLLFNAAPMRPNRSHAHPALLPQTEPVLQRLMFMKSVDLLVRCSSARQKRVSALNCASTELTRLRYLYESPRYVHCSAQESGDALVVAGSSGAFIKKSCLCRDNEQLVSQFADYAHAAEASKCPDATYTFASVVDLCTEQLQPRAELTVVVKMSTMGRTNFEPGQRYFVFERETDLNLHKSMECLSEAAAGLTPRTFVELVTDPNTWSAVHETEHTTAGTTSASDSTITGPSAGAATSPIRTFAGVSCAQLGEARVRVDAVYRQQIDLTGGAAESPFAAVGPLTRVQMTAFDKFLHERLTVVWGPPGTGKTHFAAKSILNLIEAAARCGAAPVRVLVTATTHTAIDEILSKFVALRDLALSLPDRRDTAPWAGDKCRVYKFATKPTDAAERVAGVEYTQGAVQLFKVPFIVVGSTSWALSKEYNTRFREKFDVLIVDEASQMPVADALMPLCCLRIDANGRLLVIGDTLQLPPIVAYKFGPPPVGIPPVQGSILECLLRTVDNRTVDLAAVVQGRVKPPPCMVKLSDNFRMNSALSKFTSRLYGDDYLPSSLSRNRHGRWRMRSDAAWQFSTLLPGLSMEGALLQLPELLAVRLVPHSSHASTASSGPFSAASPAALMPLSDGVTATISALQQHEAEAAYIVSLVEALATSHSTILDANTAKDRIFVCTPHNAQKAAIKRVLTARGRAHWCDIADTTERMQGQERDVVILCLAVFSPEQVAREVDFLFSKQRLNVAISRAKMTCIVVYADALAALHPAVIGSPAANEAYEHLLAFIAVAQSRSANLSVPVPF